MDTVAQPQGAKGSATNFGRGWIPQGRDIGLPRDNQREGALYAAALPASGEDYAAPLDATRWTPDVKLRFLHVLSGHGNVRVAASAVGLSRQGAYLARRRDPAFARGWDAALVLARRHAEAVLAERALDGVVEPVWFRGEEVGARRRFDSRLLLAHIGRLDRQAEALDRSAADEGAFDRLLAEVAGLSAAEDAAAVGEDRAAFLDRAVAAAETACAAAPAEPCWDEEEISAEDDEAALADAAELAAWNAAIGAAEDAAAARWDGAWGALHAAVDDCLAGRPPLEVKGLRPPAGRIPLDGVKRVKQARPPLNRPPLARAAAPAYAPLQQRENARWQGSGSTTCTWGSGSSMPSAAPLPKPTTSCSPR
ncbi:hypothetical protein ACOYW6_01500 [Parablastomonas sp. CN1-191]|uniref:hypothetical protein n=1 Tax=Parablastomonas sp. CN1-191 TaxID=3400908 RepID=UPI003BF8B2FC